MTSEITEVPEDDAEPPEVSECAEQPERGAGRSDEVLDFLVQGKRPHELPLLLREACASGDAPLARRVLRHAAPCVDTQDERHMTALHYAAANHNRGSEGANAGARDWDGLTALHFAASAPLARLLLEAGADAGAAANSGEAVLARHERLAVHTAAPEARARHAAVAELLRAWPEERRQ